MVSSHQINLSHRRPISTEALVKETGKETLPDDPLQALESTNNTYFEPRRCDVTEIAGSVQPTCEEVCGARELELAVTVGTRWSRSKHGLRKRH